MTFMIILGKIEHSQWLKVNQIDYLLPLQPFHVLDTYANVDDLQEKFDNKPIVLVKDCVAKFIKWYKNYYQI